MPRYESDSKTVSENHAKTFSWLSYYWRWMQTRAVGHSRGCNTELYIQLPCLLRDQCPAVRSNPCRHNISKQLSFTLPVYSCLLQRPPSFTSVTPRQRIIRISENRGLTTIFSATSTISVAITAASSAFKAVSAEIKAFPSSCAVSVPTRSATRAGRGCTKKNHHRVLSSVFSSRRPQRQRLRRRKTTRRRPLLARRRPIKRRFLREETPHHAQRIVFSAAREGTSAICSSLTFARRPSP